MKNIIKIWSSLPMIAKYSLFYLFGVCSVCALSFQSCTQLKSFFTNPIVEKAGEEILKEETGIDLKLPSTTPEKPSVKKK